MIITEKLNISGNLEITNSDGIKRQAISINSNLSKDGNSFNLNFVIMDNAGVTNNLTDVQAEMDNFINTLKIKMIELGYKINIFN